MEFKVCANIYYTKVGYLSALWLSGLKSPYCSYEKQLKITSFYALSFKPAVLF